MSTTAITRRVEVAGVLTNVTSMTAVVIRTDTGATITNTASHPGTGIYSFTITDPSPGLIYTFTITMVYLGETYVTPVTVYGPGAATPSTDALITSERAQTVDQFASLDAGVLLTLIRAASARIERYCHRAFALATRIEVFDGDGTGNLFLRTVPVVSISSVVIRDRTGVLTTYDGTQVLFDERTGELQLYTPTATTWVVFPGGFQNITVTYTAGFTSIPEDVQEACIHMMAWLRQSVNTNPLLLKRRIGDYEEQYRASSAGSEADISGRNAVPAVVRQLLSAYCLGSI